jgi:hypothetical protein
MKIHLHVVASIAILGLAAAPSATGQDAAAQQHERVAALKASLQENQVRLRGYEWIETTVISLKGDEKARKQQRCYYGADGKVQKLPVGEAAPAPQPAGGGRRGGRVKQRVVENKKEDMREYMERAAGLVHQYVPPSPSQIQKVKDAGGLALRKTPQGGARLEFTGYLQPGDVFAIDLDAAANRLSAISLATYLDTPDEPVTLAVRFATLDDGTSYAAQTTLDAVEKHIRIVIENSGHRPIGR